MSSISLGPENNKVEQKAMDKLALVLEIFENKITLSYSD